ncbi:hypothetical protein [Candidatus Colwellia aromaticivorans]|uniref:hypothetical protein n=1 Tax=Candidatus Colwellia aromaticivorans TaxID=2267621 RepID=UPI000DF1577B|nr:hypothetical protein [Candidatus Colwellia aromaticivorans]
MSNVNQTVKKLSEFKDAAKFERLATAYLRSFNPNKYQSTSHLGVNPKGSTVKAPLDGFSVYVENGELGVAGLEHTTTDISRLHDKLLKDLSTVKPKDLAKGPTGNEGDLRKAINEINGYRSKYQDIKKATIALVSTFDPKPETILDAKTLAKENDIDLEIHGGTTIANYLDTTAKGQYLRKLYLAEKPEKLSLELLREITEKQIDDYSKLIDVQLMVQRVTYQPVVSNHQFLVGESGVGKSIIAFNFFKANFDNGSAGIILSERIIDKSNSLEQAITEQLSAFENNLNDDAGATALDLCQHQLPFVIVIEDINNSDSPTKTLQKILKWIQKNTSDKWLIVCPVYPNYVDSLKYDEKVKISEFTSYVSNFSKIEANEAVKVKAEKIGVELSEVEIASICSSLGNDPLLIALSDLSSETSAADIIENYISNDICKISANFDDIYEDEVEELYEELVCCLLNNRNFNPTIKEITGWFKYSPSKLGSLKKLLKKGSAIYFSNKNGSNSLSFRHDRISLAMTAKIIAKDLNSQQKIEYICDPFYSEAIAVALVKNLLKQKSIDYLLRKNPLSLFHTFKLTTTSSLIDTTYLIKKIEAWIVETNKDKLANEYIRFEAISILSRIDSECVIPMTTLFTNSSSNEFWLEARFRNGDLNAGLNLVSRHELGIKVSGRKELLAHVFSKHGQAYSKQLSDLLGSNPKCDNTLNAGLLLAGYLGDSSLEPSIGKCWRKSKDKKENLLSYMWAAARCHENDESLLGEVCDQWAILPAEEDDYGSSGLNSFASDGLSWAFESYVPINALTYFAKRASEDERLEWPITYMFRVLGVPVAVQHIVESLAKRYEKSKYGFFVSSTFTDHYRRKNKMSDESKKLLEKIIKDKQSSLSMVKAATKIYGSVEKNTDLSFLNSIYKEDDAFEWAIFQRAKRGDLSVINSVIELIPSNKRYWWQTGRYVWNKELTDYFSKTISEISTEKEGDVDYILSELLMEMELDTSNRILLDNWEKVKSRRRFIQAALYISLPKLLELVHKEVESSTEPQDIFKHVLMAFGDRTNGRKGITRLKQVEALWRYKEHLSESDIHSLWNVCNRNKWFQYRRTNIDESVSKNKYRSITSINTDTLEKEYADEQALSWRLTTQWFEDCIESGFEHSDLVNLVIKWFETKKDVNSFNIVNQIAMKMFTRKDMAKLNNAVNGLKDLDRSFKNLDFYIKNRSLS